MLYRLLLLIVISCGIMPLVVMAQTATTPLTNKTQPQLQDKLQLGSFVEIVKADGTTEVGLVTKLDDKSLDLRTSTADINIIYAQIRGVNKLNKHKSLLGKIKTVALTSASIPVYVVVGAAYSPLIVLYLIGCAITPCA